jgi:hypothetical protein
MENFRLASAKVFRFLWPKTIEAWFYSDPACAIRPSRATPVPWAAYISPPLADRLVKLVVDSGSRAPSSA